ncbi:MAG: hypothetical protein GY797_01570 [Deltaproteobacteria bacterium]|nr:hypothetical protein [Deltaproteobacteria bacterium]
METKETNNTDIVGLYNRFCRFIVELNKSQSSPIAEMREADKTRLASYLDAVDTYHQHVMADPELDLPESSPMVYALRDYPVASEVENESVNDFQRLMHLMVVELINSTSSRLPAGLVKFDSIRLTAIVEKARRFLVDYVEVATPLDQPESSPRAVSSGSGSIGINP